MIGHSSVTMTEKYANFNLRRLRKDFPSLEEQIDERLKTEKFGFRDTHFRDTIGSLMPVLEKIAVAERCLHTAEVTGSSPVSPTTVDTIYL